MKIRSLSSKAEILGYHGDSMNALGIRATVQARYLQDDLWIEAYTFKAKYEQCICSSADQGDIKMFI